MIGRVLSWVQWAGTCLVLLSASLPGAAAFSSCEVLVECPWGAGEAEMGIVHMTLPGRPNVKGMITPEHAVEGGDGVFIADTVNRRIAVWRRGSQPPLGVIALPSNPRGDLEPSLLAATDDGCVFVAPRLRAGQGDRGRTEDPGILKLDADGRVVQRVRAFVWPDGKEPGSGITACALGLWSVGADLYVHLEDVKAEREGIFRVGAGDDAATPVVAIPWSLRQRVEGMACLAVDGQPVFYRFTRGPKEVADGSWRHRWKWTAFGADGATLGSGETQVRAPSDGLGFQCLGADRQGAIYFAKRDWVQDAEGRYSTENALTSVVAIDAKRNLLLEQPYAELEALVREAGVTSWQRWIYMSAGESGALYVSLVSEDRFRLVAFH